MSPPPPLTQNSHTSYPQIFAQRFMCGNFQMLSPREDDDDSHLCIRCNATIVGLENYVKHRKQRCMKVKVESAKVEISTIDPLEPIYSLGADVFFQSLELQSSVKKSSLSRLTPPLPLTKSNVDRKNVLVVASSSRDVPVMSPLESNLRGEDWIGGHSLRIGSNEDNQTKLINAVASISGSVKKEVVSTTYTIDRYNDYKGVDDSDDLDDSEDEEDEGILIGGGKWKPPANYTGGKWRPASPDHDDWEEHEHTGGKWKSLLNDSNEKDDEDYDAPPPGHTKGKWVPGAHEKTQIMQTTIQTKGSVQYWCGPCNRRLGSRVIYEKHLMSNLHMRKVLPEHELEFSGPLEPMRNAVEKRVSRPSRHSNDGNTTQMHKNTKRTDNKKQEKIKTAKKKRKRKLRYLHCPGCKSRVRAHLMGKHLISHYHFRKVTENQSSDYHQLILENIEAIVHQSPFQCSPCKFYTNWLSNFMQHWFSDDHEKKLSSIEGSQWCSFCKFECQTSQEMLQHMSGPEHSEVVAVINRSMPIIIRKKSIISCGTCKTVFRFNLELKMHCKNTGHQLSCSATDDYQEFHKCKYCVMKFKSSLTLAAHLKNDHKQTAYHCTVCMKTFESSDEAKKHRNTSEHRIRKKEKMRERGVPIKDLSKKCPYCSEKVVVKNIIELKEHIRKEHPNIKKLCPNCGMAFTLSQEVTRHVRNNACQFQCSDSLSASTFWNCSQCLFTTDSKAECYFHEILHSKPIEEVRKYGNKERIIKKYVCPLCPKTFKKASLREHLRQHTFERPFVCTICGANFTRQASLSNHSKNEHGTEMVNVKAPKLVVEAQGTVADGEWKCSKCQKCFANKTALYRHRGNSCAEDRRCPHEECTFVATTAAQLAKHRKQSHGDQVKCHECQLCPFKSDQASHLKRHKLTHASGALSKPYACPHCSFTCGSLENLRKHVLHNRLHEGLFLYLCRLCEFKTNFAAVLREHFQLIHGDKYDSKTAFQAVKTHLLIQEAL